MTQVTFSFLLLFPLLTARQRMLSLTRAQTRVQFVDGVLRCTASVSPRRIRASVLVRLTTALDATCKERAARFELFHLLGCSQLRD